jgi:hypothetical protein
MGCDGAKVHGPAGQTFFAFFLKKEALTCCPARTNSHARAGPRVVANFLPLFPKNKRLLT